MVGKGIVSTINGNQAVIAGSGGIATAALSVPERFLNEPETKLKVGESVAYVLFKDGSGIVLERF